MYKNTDWGKGCSAATSGDGGVFVVDDCESMMDRDRRRRCGGADGAVGRDRFTSGRASWFRLPRDRSGKFARATGRRAVGARGMRPGCKRALEIIDFCRAGVVWRELAETAERASEGSLCDESSERCLRSVVFSFADTVRFCG